MALDLLTSNDVAGEYPQSWYSAITPQLEQFSTLRGAQNKYDVCVVGGGYTGLSSALHLAKAGYKVCVLEANRVGWGASGRNGGQVGSGQRQDQDFIEKHYGDDAAQTLWALAEESKKLVRNLITEHKINCDPVDGIIEADHKQSYVSETHEYVKKLNMRYGYEDIVSLSRDELYALIKSDAYFGGAIDKGAFHINPLAFSLGLAKACIKADVDIFEHSKVVEIDATNNVLTKTNEGEVSSDFLVLACNGYLGDLEKDVAARVMPINNFMIVTEPLGILQNETMGSTAAVADSKFVINYFRMSKSENDDSYRMIFGGGENYGYHFPKDIKGFVQKPMLKIFPQLADTKIEYGWGGTLAITMKRLPHFTRVRGNTISCSGYSGHGIGLATLAGKLVSEAIAGQAERFDQMAHFRIGRFPGGTKFRTPILHLAMRWFVIRDKFF